MKKIISLLLICGSILSCSGCLASMTNTTPSAIGSYNFDEMELVQLQEPKEGQQTATIETTLGDITILLYPEYAPNTVNNFVNRAKEGFYDGKDIYGVMEKAFFLTGAYNEERTQGVTEDGELIANECDVDLWTFKGAVCSYSGTPGYSDSRFFVVNGYPLTVEEVDELRSFKNSEGEKLLPDELINAFVEKGCIAGMSGCYTVFGQVIEGYDVLEAICNVEVDKNSEPVEKIYIEKITVSEYSAD